MAILPQSLLNHAIKALTKEQFATPQAAKNELLKKGVKPDELKFSGMDEALEMHGNKPITKEQLGLLEKARKDVHGETVKQTQGYAEYTAPEADLGTYGINVRRFEEQGSRPMTPPAHMSELQDQIWWTRTTEGQIGDQPTRVIHELQSDPHQRAIRFGYSREEGLKKQQKYKTQQESLEQELVALKDQFFEKPKSLLADTPRPKSLAEAKKMVMADNKLRDFLSDRIQPEVAELGGLLEAYTDPAMLGRLLYKQYDELVNPTHEKIWKPGVSQADYYRQEPHIKAKIQKLEQRQRQLDSALTADDRLAETPFKDLPYKKDWHTKALEQELISAVTTGRKAIAVPIEGPGVKRLVRSPGIQKDFYEKKVRKDMQKLAKDIGGEYREVSAASTRAPVDEEEAFHILNTNLELKDWVITRYNFQESVDPTDLDHKLAEVLRTDWSYIKENAPLDQVAFDEVTYGQIILPEGKEFTKKLTLYSAGGAEAVMISQALEEDLLPDEIKDYLVTEKGMSEADASNQVDQVVRERLKSALDQEIPAEEVVNYLVSEKGYDEEYVNSLLAKPKPERVYPEAKPITEEEMVASVEAGEAIEELSPEERAAKVNDIYRKWGTLGKVVVGGFIDPAYVEEAQIEQKLVSRFILENLSKEGHQVQLNPATGEILIQTPSGIWDELTPSVWEDIKAAGGETVGAVGGAIAGGKAGAAMTPPVLPFVGPFAKPLGASLGAIVGGATGAALGRGFDINRNALEVNETISKQLIISRMKDAAAADAIIGVLGLGAVKLASSVWRGFTRSYDLVAAGNKQGAYNSMKELMHLTDDQIDTIIKEWEDITGRTAPGMTRTSKALAIVPRVTPGGEAIVGPATKLDPVASANVAKEIDLRAKDLLDQVATATSDNISTILRDELSKYKASVKRIYSSTKEHGVRELENTGYSFDYSKLAIDPVLERATAELTNPAIRERALNLLARVRQLGGKEVVTERPTKKAVPSVILDPTGKPIEKMVPAVTKEVEIQPSLRSFGDLLELRRVVNEFGSGKFIKNAKDIDLLATIRKNIDSEITRAANKHMENPKVWLKTWRKARTEYSKMFALESNVLHKAIMKSGGTDKKVAKQLMEKSMATDHVFREVVEKLPPQIRALTENTVMEEFVQQFTKGEAGGMRATHFPLLAEQLAQVPFTSPKAQSLKRVIADMARVFKNDVDLARVTGTIRTPQFQSYLTTDPIIRAKYEIASSVFNYIKRVLPGKKADAIALVMKMGKVLEKPQNAKTFDELLRALPADPELKNTLKAAQLELAKFGQRSVYPQVEVYRSAEPGKTFQVTKGPLGEGVYYNVTKKGAAKRAKGKMHTQRVLPGRIANESNIQEVLGDIEITPKVIRENPQLQETLKAKGFEGLTLGKDVLIFK